MLSERARQARLARARRRETKQAPDLARHINSVNDTARQCATHYAGFLFLAGGLFILISGTTHEDLLRETPVQMPLFNIGVPLKTFYVLAPLIFLILHVNLLNKLAQLRTQFEELGPPEARPGLRTHLFQFDYALLLGGFVGKFSERIVLWVIVGMTVFLMPVMLLIYTQYKFLPYHSYAITGWHSALVTFAVGALVFFHAAIAPVRLVSRAIAAALTLIFVILPIGVSWWFFKIPGNIDERITLTDLAWIAHDEYLHLGLARNLSLPGRSFWASEAAPVNVALYEARRGFSEATSLDAQKKYARPMNLIGRDLRYADLTGATLIGANLSLAQLNWARLAGTNFSHATIKGAVFKDAELENSVFYDVVGSPWTDDDAGRTGVLSKETKNDVGIGGVGYDFSEVKQATSFEGAYLYNVNFRGANLTGANFKEARFDGGHLDGADFSDVDFRGAVLNDVTLEAASFERSLLVGFHVSGTLAMGGPAQAANFSSANMMGATLYNLDLRGSQFEGAKFEFALIELASLWGTLWSGLRLPFISAEEIYGDIPVAESNYDIEHFWELKALELREILAGSREEEKALSRFSSAGSRRTAFDPMMFYPAFERIECEEEFMWDAEAILLHEQDCNLERLSKAILSYICGNHYVAPNAALALSKASGAYQEIVAENVAILATCAMCPDEVFPWEGDFDGELWGLSFQWIVDGRASATLSSILDPGRFKTDQAKSNRDKFRSVLLRFLGDRTQTSSD